MAISPFVSIILPCYKEEEHLRISIEELVRVARSFDFTYEFIFVEDRSPDNTRSILKQLEVSIDNAQFIYHEKNSGRGGALKSGYAAARGTIVGYLDIDLEISAKYIADAVLHLKIYDVVIANRAYFSQLNLNSMVRNLTSRTYKRFSRMSLKHKYADTEAGFKFFVKEKVDPFFNEVLDNHWFWDTEFMMNVQKCNLSVFELPVEFIRNNRKKSTVRIGSDTRKYIAAIFRYRNRK